MLALLQRVKVPHPGVKEYRRANVLALKKGKICQKGPQLDVDLFGQRVCVRKKLQ